MIPDINLLQLSVGIALGLVAGVSAMWHEARKAHARGFRHGFEACEDKYCSRIQEAIRTARVECGLPPEPEPVPPMPSALRDDLALRWSPRLSPEPQSPADALAGDFH